MGVTERRFCGSKKTDGSGDTCRQPAGAGTNHVGWGKCRFHGGNSPALQKDAAKQETAARMVAFGTPIEIDPGTALLTEVKRSAGVVQWLSEVISAFTSDINLSGGTREARDVVQSLGEQGREAAVWVDLFFKERRQLAQVAKMALDAGVAERQVQLQEEQGRMLVAVIQGVLGDLSLSVEQRAAVPGIVRKHLLAIEAKSA